MTQFSELHDASSKPWIQLSSFTALVFLLLTQNCSGLPQVVGPSQPILATVGGDVVLSCRLEPAVDASGMSMQWSREDLDPSYVYVWRAGEELESSKHPDYKGRTSLLFSELKFGDISLKLSKVKPSDEGKYTCFIPTLGRGSTVELVVGAVSLPVISLAGLGRTSSSVELECKSAGWYPEPEVLWLDGDGNLLSAGPTETVRGSDDLYTVSSRVTVEKKHGNKFTCRVQQNNIKQTREALIQVTDDFFIIQSSYTSNIVGLAVSLAAAFILLILAVVLFVRTRRQKRKKKIFVNEELKQERQKNENLNIRLIELEGNNSETDNQLQQEKLKNEKAENDMKILKNQLEELQRTNSEMNNQLQQEKLKNEFLKNQLEERERNYSEIKIQLQQAQQKNDNLDSRLTKVQNEKEKQMQDFINSVAEKMASMTTEKKPKNKKMKNILKLQLTGSITLEEVDNFGHYIRLKNISSEEIKLGGWNLELQINNSKPAEYRFNESVKLQAGGILTIWNPDWSSEHSDDDDDDLMWSDMMEWWPEDKLQIKLISNDGKTFKLL